MILKICKRVLMVVQGSNTDIFVEFLMHYGTQNSFDYRD